MADKKISALTAATTPLAGTEVLPIVQSSATVKVSVDNLTTGKTVPVGSLSVSGSQPRITADMSNATQTNRLFFQNSIANTSTSVGVMPSGSGTSSRLNLFNGSDPDNAGYLQAQISATNAIFNSAKTGTGTALPYVWQIGSVTYLGLGTSGDLTISSGNLIQGTAAKGVNFTANTPAAGMTSQLLNWYEEGTFTPQVADAASGGNTATFSGGAAYTRIGRQVTLYFYADNIDTTGMTAGNAVYFRNFPFTSSSNNKSMGAFYSYRVGGGSGQSASVVMGSSVTYARIFIYTGNSATADTILKVSDLVSGTSSIYFSLTYFV